MAGTASEGMVESAEVSSCGDHETVTLRKETTTPRARSLTSAFKRVRTPPSESQPARRQRKKNEHNARQRAICRLDADGEHARYKEAERARKRSSRPALAWEKPTFWQLPCEARTHIEERSSWLLHEHVQLSRREAAAPTASTTPRRAARCGSRNTSRRQMGERRASRGAAGGRA